MNKKIIILSGIILIVVAGCAYFMFSKKESTGRVLGASINKFYSDKLVSVKSPPVKNPGVNDPIINAESAILIRADDKYPLYEKNSTERAPVASITKIMTAIVSLENYNLDDVVEVKKENTEVIPSKIFLVTGEKITVDNLLHGALIASGNDAAMALSTYKMTQPEFVAKMNEKAGELGMVDTKFMDPAGLNDDGRSTAKDIAILFSYALKNDTFKSIVSTSEYKAVSVDGSQTHDLKNSNRMITGELPLDGVVGGKTGFTLDAGHTLVCAATRNNETLVAVVLKTISNAPSASAEENRKLLSWGFESFKF
jgi:D-alanyl-D-alanine carboxypeptidase